MPEERPGSPGPPAGDAPPVRVLVIDDETSIRMMIGLALRHVGHAVETASDGLEGLQRFGDGSAWDVVLLDHRMPGMPGMEVLREMRQRDPDARVVVVTAFGTVDLATEAREAGACGFLRKPFTADILRDAVRAAAAEAGGPPAGAGSGTTAINGFRIQVAGDCRMSERGELRQDFAIQSPTDESCACRVILGPSVVTQARAQAQDRRAPADDFWAALAEEALANYVWQNADVPAGGALRVNEMSASLARSLAGRQAASRPGA